MSYATGTHRPALLVSYSLCCVGTLASPRTTRLDACTGDAIPREEVERIRIAETDTDRSIPAHCARERPRVTALCYDRAQRGPSWVIIHLGPHDPITPLRLYEQRTRTCSSLDRQGALHACLSTRLMSQRRSSLPRSSSARHPRARNPSGGTFMPSCSQARAPPISRGGWASGSGRARRSSPRVPTTASTHTGASASAGSSIRGGMSCTTCMGTPLYRSSPPPPWDVPCVTPFLPRGVLLVRRPSTAWQPTKKRTMDGPGRGEEPAWRLRSAGEKARYPLRQREGTSPRPARRSAPCGKRSDVDQRTLGARVPRDTRHLRWVSDGRERDGRRLPR